MLSKQGIRWPVSHDLIAGSGVDPSKFRTILKKQEMLTPLHGYVIGQGYKRKMLYEQILFAA